MFSTSSSTECRSRAFGRDDGQSISEVPVVVITLLMFFLMIMQPAVLLYDRTVLNNAAAETARVLVTDQPAGDAGKHQGAVTGFALRRCEAIPDAPFFRVGEPEVEYPETGTGSQWVSVRITVKAKPIPLIGLMGDAVGLTGEDGNFEVEGYARVPAAIPNLDGGYDPPGWYEDSPLRRK